LNFEKNSLFGFIECYDDQEIAHALLQTIENWGKRKGMERMIGPYGFSDKDPQGLLIEGFEHLGMIASNCNYPFLVTLVENEGYTKEVDCLAFRLPVNFAIPEKHRLIYERALRNNRYEVREFQSRSQLKPLVVPILRVMNECYKDIYGFIPMSEKEMKDFAARYLPILDPRFAKIIVVKDEILGFVIGLPSISRGLQKSGGYLWPFGIIHILRSMKKTKKIDLMLGGVKPEYQGLGLDLLMGFKLLDSAKAAGFEQIEVHLILETNYKMLAEVLRLNAEPHKRFRVFQKNLLVL
jgi:GNAT superfamily N-acetyltransferase